jgi:hypothetical protein
VYNQDEQKVKNKPKTGKRTHNLKIKEQQKIYMKESRIQVSPVTIIWNAKNSWG